MNAAETDADKLQAHMASTYVNLRLGIGAIGIGLPLVLWLGGRILDHESLRGSMSDYYYSATMGDVFVGGLVATGVFLYLYKGFSTLENWALNLAGALVVGVAFFPTTAPGDANSGGFSLHGTFAVLFFLCIAYVSVFRAGDTLSLIKDPKNAQKLRATYRALGVAMLVSPIVAVVLNFVLQRTALIFFVEALASLAFALYWLVKTSELRATNAERLALAAKLRAKAADGGVPAFGTGELVKV